MTDTKSQIALRLRVPCTPSEIAAHFGLTRHLARSYLYELRKQGRAHKTDRRVPRRAPRGRQWEYAWEATCA